MSIDRHPDSGSGSFAPEKGNTVEAVQALLHTFCLEGLWDMILGFHFSPYIRAPFRRARCCVTWLSAFNTVYLYCTGSSCILVVCHIGFTYAWTHFALPRGRCLHLAFEGLRETTSVEVFILEPDPVPDVTYVRQSHSVT